MNKFNGKEIIAYIIWFDENTMFLFFEQGLCKLGSAGGSDASDKTLAEGSTLALAKVCRKYVIIVSSHLIG